MRNQSPSQTRAILPLIEQLIMLLVFMIAAAVCLRAFVYSDALSRDAEARDRAMELCRNTAEAIKHHGGEPEEAMSAAAGELGISYGAYDGAAFEQHYNADWTLCDSRDYRYCLTAAAIEDGASPEGLCRARVAVTDAREDGQAIFSLDIAWQREATDLG